MSEWSKNWKSSSKPSKQRKHRENAPYHQRKKFLNARLADDVREKIGTKTLPVRKGDKAEIMRGEWADATGQIDEVDYDDKKLFISGVETERVDTSDARIPIDPSNVQIVKLDLEDEQRIKKYDVSEQDRQEIQVDEEEEADDQNEETAEDDVEDEGNDNDEKDEGEN